MLGLGDSYGDIDVLPVNCSTRTMLRPPKTGRCRSWQDRNPTLVRFFLPAAAVDTGSMSLGCGGAANGHPGALNGPACLPLLPLLPACLCLPACPLGLDYLCLLSPVCDLLFAAWLPLLSCSRGFLLVVHWCHRKSTRPLSGRGI